MLKLNYENCSGIHILHCDCFARNISYVTMIRNYNRKINFLAKQLPFKFQMLKNIVFTNKNNQIDFVHLIARFKFLFVPQLYTSFNDVLYTFSKRHIMSRHTNDVLEYILSNVQSRLLQI